jgi:hypothetical protein
MKVPSKRTPVRKCLDGAGFSCRMFAMHEDDPRLVELGRKFDVGRIGLVQAEGRLIDTEAFLNLVRVDVTFEDYSSDRFLRRLLARIEAQDGRKGGRLSKLVFPDGVSDITKRQGDAQVEKMRALEARLATIQDWDDALNQMAALIVRRTRYENALAQRLAAERQVVTERANRDGTKERFLDLYAEIAAQVRSIFPRDRRTQDLFFDDLSPRSRRYAGEPDGELPDEPADDDETP